MGKSGQVAVRVPKKEQRDCLGKHLMEGMFLQNTASRNTERAHGGV